jgi:hypothetical protein
VALFFLIKSMNRHLRKVPAEFGSAAGSPTAAAPETPPAASEDGDAADADPLTSSAADRPLPTTGEDPGPARSSR